MQRDGLTMRQEIAHVLKGPAALPIPEHEAIGSVCSHLQILHRVEIEAAGARWCFDRANLPVPDVVSKHVLHRVDDDSLVPSVSQMLLERTIGAISITDEHPQAAVEEFVELRSDVVG
jgi:hypothetical protein